MAVTFSSQGDALVTSSLDGSTRVWTAPTLSEIETQSRQERSRAALYQARLNATQNRYPHVENAEMIEKREAARRDAALGAEWQRERSARLRQMPPRSREAGNAQIDLTGTYNATFDKPWSLPGETRPLYLTGLQPGLQTLAGICYDARGVAQLHSPAMPFEYYPERVGGIALNRVCERLYFLHSASWWAKPKTRIGEYVIHYANGQTAAVPIIYGENILEWLSVPGSLPNATLAWTGKDTGLNDHERPHLYQFVWENPHPDLKIATLDFVTEGGECVPFLVALTAQ